MTKIIDSQKTLKILNLSVYRHLKSTTQRLEDIRL